MKESDKVYPTIDKYFEVTFPKGMSQEAIKVYENNTVHFRDGQTYKSDIAYRMKESLAHRYGVWKLELYYDRCCSGRSRDRDTYKRMCML